MVARWCCEVERVVKDRRNKTEGMRNRLVSAAVHSHSEDASAIVRQERTMRGPCSAPAAHNANEYSND